MGNTLQIYQKKPTLSNTDKIKVFFSCICGIFLGVATSFVVNATLVEISLNKFFSFVIFLKISFKFLKKVLRRALHRVGTADNLSNPGKQLGNAAETQEIPAFFRDSHGFLRIPQLFP